LFVNSFLPEMRGSGQEEEVRMQERCRSLWEPCPGVSLTCDLQGRQGECILTEAKGQGWKCVLRDQTERLSPSSWLRDEGDV
jgi:hypothetical protein